MGCAPLTNLEDALTGVAALGFDTPPFIYFVERHPSYVDVVRDLFRRIDLGLLSGFASVITLTEVLTMPKRLDDRRLEREYRDLLLRSRNFAVVPIDTRIAEEAAEIRAQYRLRTPDALQVAAALRAGCDAFLTNDAQLVRVTELRVITLDDLEL
jgi:predicted nucleic acid-binding protein